MTKIMITISFVAFFTMFNVINAQNNDNSYISETYKIYYEHRETKDSIINVSKQLIAKDSSNLPPNILLGLIYMNEQKFDSAIVYLQYAMDYSINHTDKGLNFYTNAAFMLLDAYRYTFRFREYFKYYSLYWPFLQDDGYKKKLEELEANIKMNVRWWFIDFARQIVVSEFNQAPESYIFGFVDENNYKVVSSDIDANRLVQNRTNDNKWATVMMLPSDATAKYYYCFYFYDYQLVSYLKLLRIDYENKDSFNKESISKLLKPLTNKSFDESKASFEWHSVAIELDNGNPFEVLMLN